MPTPPGRNFSDGDGATLEAYDRAATFYADDWDAQPTPSDVYALLRRFFSPGPTADIGCGAGRDTAWLNATGYSASGYDASEGLLAEARRRHPKISFHRAALPGLSGLAENSFTNVLCETVIMHLEQAAIVPGVSRLLAILKPGGTLYLGWRVTSGTDLRDPNGRLYAAFDTRLVTVALKQADILLDEQSVSGSSGKAIHRLVARKRSTVA